jgi:hypothetical protein
MSNTSTSDPAHKRGSEIWREAYTRYKKIDGHDPASVSDTSITSTKDLLSLIEDCHKNLSAFITWKAKLLKYLHTIARIVEIEAARLGKDRGCGPECEFYDILSMIRS